MDRLDESGRSCQVDRQLVEGNLGYLESAGIEWTAGQAASKGGLTGVREGDLGSCVKFYLVRCTAGRTINGTLTEPPAADAEARAWPPYPEPFWL